MNPLLGMLPFGLGFWEMAVIAGLGVILFGKRLPEVGRYLGKGIIEFKKGLRGLEDDVEATTVRSDAPVLEQPRPPQRVATTAPKFEDVPGPSTNAPK